MLQKLWNLNIEQGDIWSDHILNTISWNVADDSERMFQLRLTLARKGIVRDFVDWKSLCANHPLRAIQLIEAVISTWDIGEDSTKSQKGRLESWYDKDREVLYNTAKEYPVETWDLIVPHIERLTSFQAEPYDLRLEKWKKNRFLNDTHTDIARGIVNLVMISGQVLASINPDSLVARTNPLEQSPSSIIQEILMVVYRYLPVNHADIGIRWLLADVSRFRIGSGYIEPEWQPDVHLIKALSPYCSEVLFQHLEEAIVHYNAPEEKQLATHYLKGWKDGYFDHYWGKTQYFLLPALSADRIKPHSTALISVLHRKFSSYAKDDFLRAGSMLGGQVGSKLDPSLEKISDHAWLDIINSKKITERGSFTWIQAGSYHILETSIRQFSSSLGRIAKRFPERFGKLALQFPDDVAPSYLSAILDGLSQKTFDSNIPEEERESWQASNVETVEAVLAKFKTGDDQETARSFCHLISGRAEENWSDATLDKIIHYARNHPDPESGQLNVYSDQTADEASVEVLFQNTINCVRGVAAQAIRRLLWEHTDWLEKLRPGIESLVQDQHPTVRMAAAETLLPIININKDLAVRWFCQTCADDLRVPASPRVSPFFNYVFPGYLKDMSPIIQKMLCSSLDDVSREGAIQVTARWLFYGLFETELTACQKGTVPQRQGIALVASKLLYDRKYSTSCQTLLQPFLNDPDKEVRDKLHRLFHKPDLFSNPSFKEFVLAYIDSQTFADDPDGFVYFLNGSSPIRKA